MKKTVIKIENLYKEYKLGVIGHGTLYRDLQSWWARMRGKEDPNSIISQQHNYDVENDSILSLQDISFEVKQGEILGVIGRNGAGKSTLLKILTRITGPTKGTVKIKGRVGSLLEVGTGFHPELTGRENIYLNGSILGMNKREIIRKLDEIVEFAEIAKFLDTPVKRYSSGMYVRLAFSIAAHLEPEILLVDEVLAVGDATFQRKCLGKMGDVAKEGRTILFVSHNMAAIQNLCTKSMCLECGKIQFIGETEEAIKYYLSSFRQIIEEHALADRIDRRGNGKIKLTSFHIEDTKGNRLSSVMSGSDVIFVFNYNRLSEDVKNVDMGFGLRSTQTDEVLSILYSSYQNQTFSDLPQKGQIRCKVKRFPFSKNSYKVGARIVVNGEEADWPNNGVGYITVEKGDFFGTGREGFEGTAPFLIKGDWEISDTGT